MTLDLSVNRPTAFVCVRLNDVKPDGSSTRVAYAVMNLTHRNGHHRTQKLIPGRQYRVNFQLSDAAYSFIRGHRLRIAISTTYWPMIWPSPEPVELTLHTHNSSIQARRAKVGAFSFCGGGAANVGYNFVSRGF